MPGSYIDTFPWKKFGPGVLSLPTFGLFFCVIYSLRYYFEEANATHCNVWNFLPSISAAAGSREPQMSVWWYCIVLHTPGRYFTACSHLVYYNTRTTERWKHVNYPWIITILLFNFVEITALLLLTLVTSTSDFGLHKTSFITFLFSSVAYMLGTIWLHTSLYSHTAQAKLGVSLRYKKMLFTFYLCCLLGAAYFYWRHNTYCEPSVYSMFSLCEYLLVLTNVGFHCNAVLDLTPTGLPSSSSSDAIRRRISLDIL